MVRQELILVLSSLVVISNSMYTNEKEFEEFMNDFELSNSGQPSSSGQKSTAGNKVGLGAYPSMAAIGYTIKDEESRSVEYLLFDKDPIFKEDPLLWMCGGSLITDRFVLTAANCLDESLFSGYKIEIVRFGVHDLSDNTNDKVLPLDITVERTIMHPKYNTKAQDHDIGLVRLKDRVRFDGYKRPIHLPTNKFSEEVSYDGEDSVVLGWGARLVGGPSNVLKKLSVKTNNCQNSNRDKVKRNKDSVICAASNTNSVICVGDNGGPLIITKNFTGQERNYLAGVVSKYGCGNPKTPSVFTKVSYYMEWIQKQLES